MVAQPIGVGVQQMNTRSVLPFKLPSVADVEQQTLDSLFSVLHIDGGILVRPKTAQSGAANAQPLTGREHEVLSIVAEGCTNKRIAIRLGISERTVKHHLTSIMTKLRAQDRTHAVVIAVRLGWVAI